MEVTVKKAPAPKILTIHTEFIKLEAAMKLSGIMAGYNPKLVPLAAFFYAYVKEGAAILARATDIPVELVSIIQAIIIMLVVAERFLYKQKHRMMVKAAEKELEFRNQQAAKEAE